MTSIGSKDGSKRRTRERATDARALQEGAIDPVLEFAAAALFLVITPGPGVLSTAGVGSAYGRQAGLTYVGGLFAGNLFVSVMVITGVAAAVLAVPGLRGVLLWASALYLVYLAARIALAGAKIGFITPERPPGFWNGFALQPINPKAYVVSTTLFSGFPFANNSLLVETTLKLLIFNALWIPIHLIWLWVGLTLRRLDLPPRTQRWINVAMAFSMLAVVGLAVLRQP